MVVVRMGTKRKRKEEIDFYTGPTLSSHNYACLLLFGTGPIPQCVIFSPGSGPNEPNYWSEYTLIHLESISGLATMSTHFQLDFHKGCTMCIFF